ncbi:MAG: hypothetical protein E6Q33_01240 [Neisseriales bacterium]|nr:MAG: hypothetical protein E6Q33_01240 [Neisseriales bacterium]
MRNLAKIRLAALFAILSVSHVYALDGSTWKVMIVKNDLNHSVKLNTFLVLRGTFILAKLDNGVVVNNNWNFVELNPQSEIIIPANSSIDSKTPGNQLNFTLNSMTNEDLRNRGYNTLVFVTQNYNEWMTDRYANLIINAGLGIPEVRYGYTGYFDSAASGKANDKGEEVDSLSNELINYSYFLGYTRVSNVEVVPRASGRAIKGMAGVFSRVPEILYDSSSNNHLDVPAYNEISIAKDVCANQATIDAYLDCFKDQ